jgi:hypothetical protein
MKAINVPMDDSEKEYLLKIKGNMSWKEFLLACAKLMEKKNG